MKRKTTLYIEDNIVRELKKGVAEGKSKNITLVINEALKTYLVARPKGTKFQHVLKAKNSIPKSVFGDSLAYQKKMRAEWE